MGTIEFVDGFDDYLATLATERGWSADFTGWADGRVAGLAAYLVQQNTSRNVTSDAHYSVAAAIWFASNAQSEVSFIRMMEGATVHGSVSYNGDGTFSILNGSATVLATSAVQDVVAMVPFHLEFDYNVHDTTGSYELRLDGTAIIGPTSSVDTRNGGTGVISVVNLYVGIDPRIVYFDDLIITKGGGFQGDCRVVTQWPDADGTSTAWTDVAPPTAAYQTNSTIDGQTGGIALSWPAHAIGDIGLLIVETTGGQPVTLGTNVGGFVPVPNSPQATGIGTAGTQLSIFWARAYSAAMPDVTIADAGDHICYSILTVRGCVKHGSPFDVTAGGVKASASTSVTVPEVTTTVAGCLIVQVVTCDLDSTSAFASAQTNANLTGITEHMDAGTTSGNGGGIAAITATKTTAGATGTTAWTVTSSINAFIHLALLPAGTDDYAAVAEQINNSDTDYIYSATATDRETFAFPDVGVVGTVKAVAVNHVSRKDDAGTRLVAPSVRSGGTNYDGTGVALSTSYAAYQAVYETDPATAAAWTVANIDAGEFGVYLDT